MPVKAVLTIGGIFACVSGGPVATFLILSAVAGWNYLNSRNDQIIAYAAKHTQGDAGEKRTADWTEFLYKHKER